MLSKHTITIERHSINMNYAINCIMSTFIYIYSITGTVALISISTPLHTLLPDIIPKPPQCFGLTQEPIIDYICTRYECTINNTHTDQTTWGQQSWGSIEHLVMYILFNILAATVIPFTAKYIADSIAEYIVQRVTKLFTFITIRSFSQHHLQIEDIDYIQDNQIEDFDEQHDFNTDDEYTIPTFFPRHMSGHLPPIRSPLRQRQSFGRLASQQFRHTPTTILSQNTRFGTVTHAINLSILASLFTNTNPSHDTQVYTGIPIHIKPAYVHTATKTFAGDSCPICMTRFHILEICNKTLAVTNPCNHLFCHACIDKYVNNHALVQAPCPLCRAVVEELYITK